MEYTRHSLSQRLQYLFPFRSNKNEATYFVLYLGLKKDAKSPKKEEKPKGVRRTVYHNAMKKNAMANRNLEIERERSHQPLGSRQIKTATSTITRDAKNNVGQSIDRSSNAASGNQPRRPLSTDQTITLSHQEYPSK